MEHARKIKKKHPFVLAASALPCVVFAVGAVELRKFLYPYKASLAVCSDMDYTPTMKRFLEMHRYFETFSLEIGDTFWVDSNASKHFTHVDGLKPVKSEKAEHMRKLVRAGYLHCLHTYANFGPTGGSTREMAATAIQKLERNGMG